MYWIVPACMAMVGALEHAEWAKALWFTAKSVLFQCQLAHVHLLVVAVQ